jgi:hypothetical protein
MMQQMERELMQNLMDRPKDDIFSRIEGGGLLDRGGFFGPAFFDDRLGGRDNFFK